jgi:hypothetical protein
MELPRNSSLPMSVRHSNSLIFIWRVAELEARLLNSFTIEPPHLLLGLCKAVDMDLPGLFEKRSPDREEVLGELVREVGRLRSIFETTHFDARRFRRALRRAIVQNGPAAPESQQLRRSKNSKQLFALAEHFAEVSNCSVFPVQLLYAILSTKEASLDNLMLQLGVDPQCLRKVAKREVWLGWIGDRSVVGRN